MSNRDDLQAGNAGSSNHESGWADEDTYWQGAYASRPYAKADRGYDYYGPGYRYGYESATRHRGRQWNEVESELRSGWEGYEHRGTSQGTWEDIKDSVRDAWDRVTGKGR